MLGDTVRDEGREYEIVWDGVADAMGLCPSLLGPEARPSVLSEPSRDKSTGIVGRMTPQQLAVARRELAEQA